jgi:hypothetical protein
MKWLERLLFPRSQLANFFIVACLSMALSFALIGRQVWQANWGLIDDHEVFSYLGPSLYLPPAEIWNTLLTKTEVGTFQGRFRPSFYAFKIIETSLWGANVHLWYLTLTVFFAVFLASIWWFMRRFIGGWLSGLLTISISMLPLWADVWSRLGPSEGVGAACLGIMTFASYFILFSERARVRILCAIVLTIAAILLAGMKETFFPLAAGAIVVLVAAQIQRKLSLPVVAVLTLAIVAAIGGILLVVRREVAASGSVDYYANSLEFSRMLVFTGKGLLVAVARTWWIFVIPMLFLGLLGIIPRKPLKEWIRGSGAALGAYGFLVAAYAIQCGLYRSNFPLNSRYDFPAMLLVPLCCCVLTCEFFHKIGPFYSQRTINYALLTAAAFVLCYIASDSTNFDKGRTLTTAVSGNIERTTLFFRELQGAVGAAKGSPESPIILEAYGAGAYEPVFSFLSYLPAYGARNRLSVRLHPDKNSYGKLYDGLQLRLSNMQDAEGGGLTPLQASLANRSQGCVSIGLNGAPDATCLQFRIDTP